MNCLIFRDDKVGADAYIGSAKTLEEAKEVAHKYLESIPFENEDHGHQVEFPTYIEIFLHKTGVMAKYRCERIITTRLIDEGTSND